MGLSWESRVIAAHFGRDKIGALAVMRSCFPLIFKHVTEIIKYCDLCEHMNIYELQKGQEILHPIPVPLQLWSQISIDLIGPLKENEGYRYIVTAVDYTSKFVEVQLLKVNV